jgi:FixJ family two-component response regulator
MDSLTERERRLVECLVDGMNWTNAALSMGVSSWTVAADREKLSVKILEFMGVDILAVILKRPGWKNNLNANRERLACKHQRGN